MNDPITKPTASQPDALRRRLTKGGLAAPVILSSLVSKPVLANAWTCTISGQMSGNVSGHESETCDALGKTHSALSTSAYPDGYPAGDTKTLAAEFSGLTNYFFTDGTYLYNSDSPDPASVCTGCQVASIHQILTLPYAAGFNAYAVKAVVLLLNAKDKTDTSLYYITESQARGLYYSAANPLHPDFTDSDPDVTWQYDAAVGPDVKSYIDVLYRA